MFSAKSTIIIQAPKKEVWAKLSKLDDIANWSSGIGTSVYSSEITSGVGTQRSCDIPGIGTLVEDIVEWRDEHKFCYEISGISISNKSKSTACLFIHSIASKALVVVRLSSRKGTRFTKPERISIAGFSSSIRSVFIYFSAILMIQV